MNTYRVIGFWSGKYGDADLRSFSVQVEAHTEGEAQELVEVERQGKYDYLRVELLEENHNTVADDAERVVNDERVKEYGHPAKNFARIAGALNSLFGTEFKPQDVPVIMAVVKLSRIVESPQKRDSWIDLVGYALANEIAAEAEGRELE